jgi:hypothetical protein
MITLYQDQEFFNPCNFLVKDGGVYEENALVVVYDRNDLTKTGIYSFQANFIKYGIDNNLEAPTINPRDLIVDNQVELTTTGETTLLASGGTGIFHDIASITYEIIDDATTIIIRDVPGGASKIVLTGEANTTHHIKFDPLLKQSIANSNWTAQLTTANSVNITIIGIKKS